VNCALNVIVYEHILWSHSFLLQIVIQSAIDFLVFLIIVVSSLVNEDLYLLFRDTLQV